MLFIGLARKLGRVGKGLFFHKHGSLVVTDGKGFKGYMIGANYTFAKNIVGAIEWYDLESKGLFRYVPKQDMETLWAQVVFTF